MKDITCQNMRRFWTIVGIVAAVTFYFAQLYIIAAWAGLIGLLGYLGTILNQYFLNKIRGTHTPKTKKDKVLGILMTISYTCFALFLMIVIITNNDKSNMYYIISEAGWILFCLIWAAYEFTTIAIAYFRKNKQ